MHCPYCRNQDSRVLDSRVSDDGASIRRRRQCPSCDKRFTTVEQIQLAVVKKSGVTEPFNRDKVVAGVRKACKGRPVTEAQLTQLSLDVEKALKTSGSCEVPSQDVGIAILGPLSKLDEVAYLRFASVYRHFQSLSDFEDEIQRLNQSQPGPGETSESPTPPGNADQGDLSRLEDSPVAEGKPSKASPGRKSKPARKRRAKDSGEPSPSANRIDQEDSDYLLFELDGFDK